MLTKNETTPALSSHKTDASHVSLLFSVKKKNGKNDVFSLDKMIATLKRTIREYENIIDIDTVIKAAVKNIFDGISTDDIETNLILVTTSMIEKDPAYSKIASRILLQKLSKEVIGKSVSDETRHAAYQKAFINNLADAIQGKVLDERLKQFDIERLAQELVIERDDLFEYMGLQILYERYFVKLEGRRIELPQIFWMRVSMGLAINEKNPTEKAIEYYHTVSQLHYAPSTPTLFNSATVHPQLSSCYLTTIPDNLPDIFKCLGDNAQLSKWSGGLGNDWTHIRGTGSLIKTVGIPSQGVVPFLKIANDVTCAISRSGSRRGATCAYLETWHYDIEDFIDLHRNTGDERRRTHDMNTANWIPDLFMKRMLSNANWTLFSPDETPDLHDLYGKAFEERYCWYEEKAAQGKI
ncbi:hypothetical protein JKY79_00015, partial [Candidatus Babeliales bacterium]|nr:hypothetical protein [Candidatus Babeliales bacterium]